MVALIDSDDVEKVSGFKWTAGPRPGRGCYPHRRGPVRNGKRETIHLHRLVVDAPAGMHVDHKNHDTLDCRKSNLRVCTNAENRRNRKKNKNGRTPYKGVYPLPDGRYLARVSTTPAGVFETSEAAARAYDALAAVMHGEFACTNEMLGLIGRVEK
jgi:hypothetical protein